MNIRNPTPASPSSARCARCGTAFDCGSMTRPLDCWCASMPPLRLDAASVKKRRTGERGCLCPVCYADALAAAGQHGHAGGPVAAREPSTE